MSLVFIRFDKIGDLVASLSVDQHSALKGEEIHWVISRGLDTIPVHASPPRKFLSLDGRDENWKQSSDELIRFLKAKKPRAVVVFYAPWWVGMACQRAGVPLRIGRASQWHSFVFFNKRLRQKRSQSEKHEHDYNQELLEFGLSLPHESTPPLKLTAPANKTLLAKLGISKEQYFVVHPGMFGSALNWPQSKYNELIGRLVLEKCVVVTGTKDDERFLSEIKAKWTRHENVRIVQGELSLEELLVLLAGAKATIAPSTGVLHLSASLDKKSVGIYSPILAHHARRWGPRGPMTNVISPKVDCPAKTECLGPQCQYHPCMNLISVDSVIEKLHGPADA